MSQGQQHEATNLPALAKNVAFLIGIYLYFVGWTYLYLYFRHFGVSLLGLEIPLTFFFVYSYPLITTAFTWIKFFVVSTVGAMIVLAVQKNTSAAKTAAIIVLTIVLFPLSFQAAKESAEMNARSFRLGYGAKLVRFTLSKNAESMFPQSFRQANDDHELFLLVETKDRFYVVHQPTGLKEELPLGSTYIVDRATVVIADVQIVNVSIEERRK